MHPKKMLVGLLAIFVLAWGLGVAQAKPFVGNKNSKKFHVVACQYAKKMGPKNRVEFSTVAEAEKAGYVACKVCKPGR
ncbi:MAG: hypothetical protein M1453_07950 [Acidobacteria bacterium]|nr:hypothetical protein [Acidobacteriota bacterium]